MFLSLTLSFSLSEGAATAEGGSRAEADSAGGFRCSQRPGQRRRHQPPGTYLARIRFLSGTNAKQFSQPLLRFRLAALLPSEEGTPRQVVRTFTY